MKKTTKTHIASIFELYIGKKAQEVFKEPCERTAASLFIDLEVVASRRQ